MDLIPEGEEFAKIVNQVIAYVTATTNSAKSYCIPLDKLKEDDVPMPDSIACEKKGCKNPPTTVIFVDHETHRAISTCCDDHKLDVLSQMHVTYATNLAMTIAEIASQAIESANDSGGSMKMILASGSVIDPNSEN